MTDSQRRYQQMKNAAKAGPPPKAPTVEDLFPDESKEWPRWEPYRVRTLAEWMEVADSITAAEASPPTGPSEVPAS